MGPVTTGAPASVCPGGCIYKCVCVCSSCSSLPNKDPFYSSAVRLRHALFISRRCMRTSLFLQPTARIPVFGVFRFTRLLLTPLRHSRPSKEHLPHPVDCCAVKQFRMAGGPPRAVQGMMGVSSQRLAGCSRGEPGRNFCCPTVVGGSSATCPRLAREGRVFRRMHGLETGSMP